jgi:hypothetical protein
LHSDLRLVLDGRDPSGELLKTLLGIDPEPIATMKLGDRIVGKIKASPSGPDLYVSGISETAPPDGERAPRLQRIGRGLNYQSPELTAEERLRLVDTEVREWLPVPLKGIIVPAQFAPIWHTSRFEYRPRVVFQQILYELWKQSWRARRCPRCRRYFVADRPARLYCSRDCGSTERAVRNADYWREHKEKINAARRKGNR